MNKFNKRIEAKTLSKSSAPIVILTGKSALSIAVVKEMNRIFAETTRVLKEQLRRFLNPWLDYEKE